MKSAELSIAELGEQGLLQRLQAFCPATIVGDDAAVLAVPPSQSLVVTTDVLVDGVHFSDRTTAPEDAGWRAAAANLSDLAAMGATPLGITVGLGLPGELSVTWVERLYQGLAACLQPSSTPIVGGDVVRAPVITLAITAFGAASPPQLLRRSAAQPGDAILVTGYHGAARAGLELLLHPETGQDLNRRDRQWLIQAHQRPQPRLDVLPWLWEARHPDQLQALPGVANRAAAPLAGMDSSDGLADAILQICRASQVGACLERGQISVPAILTAWVGPERALEWALYGGEDFELVLCLPLEMAQRCLAKLGPGAAIVGRITAAPGVYLQDASGLEPPVTLSLAAGFQHFSAP